MSKITKNLKQIANHGAQPEAETNNHAYVHNRKKSFVNLIIIQKRCST